MSIRFIGLFAVVTLTLVGQGETGVVQGQQKSFNGYKVVRASVSNREQQNFLSKLRGDVKFNFDFWSGPQLGKYADIMVSSTQFPVLENILNKNNIEFNIFIEDVERLVLEERQSMNRANGSDMNWENYHRLDTIYAWLDLLASENPDRVQIFNVGKSFEQRDIRVLKLSNGGPANKPAVWIDGTIHAREWISTSTVTYTINQLVNNASQFEQLLDAVDFYFLPVVNPDGYEYAHTDDRMWRATRSVRSGTTCVGADCNRNFGFHWGEEGSSDNPCSEIYGGVAAFSESEAVAVRDFILDNQDVNWQAFITVHSYSQLWMTPWGYTYDFPENYVEMKRVANKAVAALASFYGTDYTTGSASEVLYTSSGTSRDWALGVPNISYVYTVELRDTGRYGFVLPPEQIIPTGIETFAGFLVVAEEVASQAKNKK